MDYDIYDVVLAPAIDKALDEIFSYYQENFSVERAEKKIKELLDGMSELKIFPERGFDADARLGKVIEPPYKTRGYVLSKDYIVLYRVDDKSVRIGHLFSTKTDYVKILRGKGG